METKLVVSIKHVKKKADEQRHIRTTYKPKEIK